MGRGRFLGRNPFSEGKADVPLTMGLSPPGSLSLMRDIQGIEETCFVTNEILDLLKSPLRWFLHK